MLRGCKSTCLPHTLFVQSRLPCIDDHDRFGRRRFAALQPVPITSMTSEPDADRESDEALLQKAAAGDQAAFAELYDRFSPPLYSLALQMLHDAHEAEDLLQDGFVYLWDKAAGYDAAKGRAFSWAMMIFRHKAIDRLRTRGRQARLAEQAAVETSLWSGDAAPAADEAANDLDRASLARQALATLPAEQRRLIELAFLKGLTHLSIAESLQLPLGSVKTSIRRGLLRLREALKRSQA